MIGEVVVKVGVVEVERVEVTFCLFALYLRYYLVGVQVAQL